RFFVLHFFPTRRSSDLAEIELIFPAEFESRLAKRVVALLCAGVAFRKIGRMRGDLVSDNAVFNVLLVGKAKVFLWCDVAQHCGAVPADHGRPDRTRDVVVPWSDVRRQRAERVKRGFMRKLQL